MNPLTRTRAHRAFRTSSLWALALGLATPAPGWATPPGPEGETPAEPAPLAPAEPAPLAPAEPAPKAPQWETSDTVMGAAVAAGGALVGMGTGALVGVLAGGSTCGGGNDEGGMCLGPVVLGLLIGGIVVGYAGSVGAMWLYADEPGRDGRLSSVFLGAGIGQVAGSGVAWGLCQLESGPGCGLGLALGLAIWGTGAALGYRLSLPDDQVAGAPHGGLIDYDPQGGLRLGAPSAELMAPPPGRDEGFGLTLTLGAGRF